MININVKMNEAKMVRPSQLTPHHDLCLSNLDLIARNVHSVLIFVYRQRPNGSPDNFFDLNKMKDALSQALVPFYPIAGRLKLDHDNGRRTVVDCNAEGALLVDAETTFSVDDLSAFAALPSMELRKLTPTVDYSGGISSFPLLVLQLTRFSCGGLSLGIGIHHGLSDGFGVFHFLRTWAAMARGLGHLTVPPFIDRTLVIGARDPPQPKFHHIEYQPSPPLKNPKLPDSTSIFSSPTSIFRITKDQINTLKLKAISKEEGGQSRITCNSFEILAAHIWQSVCKARGLAHDQETKLYIPTNGRFRLQHPPPPGYFGNVVFHAALIDQAGDLTSKPTWSVAVKIHNVMARMDNEYLRSALDYLQMQPDLRSFVRGSHTFRSPNLQINSWIKISIYDLDFGWGRPVFVGPVIPHEGMAFILPSSSSVNDGSMFLHIALQNKRVMNLFEKYFYGICSNY